MEDELSESSSGVMSSLASLDGLFARFLLTVPVVLFLVALRLPP